MKISQTINDSAGELVAGLDYDDYVIIRTDTDGNVTYVGVNSVRMNVFSKEVTKLVRSRISVFEDSGVSIPLGTFTGIAFMSYVGPDVEMRVLSLAVVNSEFSSTFTDAGINQTLHRMYIDVTVQGEIVLPGHTKEIISSTQILVSETVIVGKTPNTYFDF